MGGGLSPASPGRTAGWSGRRRNIFLIPIVVLALALLALQPLVWIQKKQGWVDLAELLDPEDVQSTILTKDTVPIAPNEAATPRYLAPAGSKGAASPDHFSCYPAVAAPGGARVCEPAVAPTWDDISATCAAHSLTSSPASVFSMRAMHWVALRLTAYAKLVAGAASSTFLVSTSIVPWDNIPAVNSSDLMTRHRLLTTHAWYYDNRFDVLVSARVACGLARAVADTPEPPSDAPIAPGPNPEASAFSAFDSVSDLLYSPARHILGVSARPDVRSSAFWSAVTVKAAEAEAAAARRGRGGSRAATSSDGSVLSLLPPCVGGAAAAAAADEGDDATDADDAESAAGRSLLLRIDDVTRVTRGSAAAAGPPSYASLVCGRAWFRHSRMRSALVSQLTELFTSRISVSLHNPSPVLTRLPALGPPFRRGGPIFTGASTRNSSLLNEGYNPPDVHAFVGSYLSAFNVMVTPMGALQKLPGTHHSAKRGFYGVMYHTTCEGPEMDPMSPRAMERLVENEEREGEGSAVGHGHACVRAPPPLNSSSSSSGGSSGGSGDSAPAAAGRATALVIDGTQHLPGLHEAHCDKFAESAPAPWYDEVVVLTHRIEANIYHWTAETLGKLGPVLDYVRSNPHVRIHVMELTPEYEAKSSKFRHAHLSLLGLDWADKVVTGYIRARVVHYPDNHGCRFPYGFWTILLRERYRAALGFDTALRESVPEGDWNDSSASAGSVGAAAGGGYDEGEGGDAATGAGAGKTGSSSSRRVAAAQGKSPKQPPLPLAAAPRKKWNKSELKRIVVLRRRTARKISNEEEFNTALSKLLRRSNTTLTIIDDGRMPSQNVVFSAVASADIIVGAHGAGQTNSIVARPGACIIEVMPTDWLVPCYWRMAGHLGLRYHMLMSKGNRLAPMHVSVRTILQAVKQCLDET